eukprot:g15891.t1
MRDEEEDSVPLVEFGPDKTDVLRRSDAHRSASGRVDVDPLLQVGAPAPGGVQQLASGPTTRTLHPSATLEPAALAPGGAPATAPPPHHRQQLPLKERVMTVMEGKAVQITMSLLTVFALYGDDLRMKFFFLKHYKGVTHYLQNKCLGLALG